MNLYTALHTSWNSLRNSEKGLSIAAKNIAHANDENYNRLVVNVNYDKIGGAEVIDIRRVVDETLTSELIKQTSKVEYCDTKLNFISKIQLFLGEPEAMHANFFPGNLSSAVSKVFNKLNALSSNTENLNARAAFVNQANTLTDMLSNIKTSLNDLKFQVVQEIEYSVSIINRELQKLQNINAAILGADKKSDAIANLEMSRTVALNNIAKYLEINVLKKENNRINLYTQAGMELLTDTIVNLKYDNNQSPSILLGDYATLDVTTSSFGKLKALYEIKDTEIPAILAEIDNFSAVLKNEFNTIYSDGLSSSGVSSLTSNIMLDSATTLDFKGEIEVVLLDYQGNQVKYIDGNKVKPLRVSLENKTPTKIIHEINQYFRTNPSTVYIDNVARDIRLLAKNLDNNEFSFDFLVDDISSKDSIIRVLDVELSYDYNQSPTGKVVLQNALISNISNFNTPLKNGTLNFTDFPIKVDIQNIPTGISSFNITTTLKIHGEETTIKYVIDKNTIEKDNLYWAVDAVGKGRIDNNNIPTQLLEASLLQNGNKSNTTGFLTLSSKDNFVALKNIDSLNKEDGKSSFIHFYGFNEFFVENNGNLAIKTEILNNPYSFNASRFRDDSYDIGIGNNSNVMELLSLSNKIVNFKNAGNLEDLSATFFGYSTTIIENSAQSYIRANTHMQHESAFKAILEDRSTNISGVNINEEIANTKILEYLHTASKKVIEVSDSLIHQLLDII